jgi:hypothetical protein
MSITNPADRKKIKDALQEISNSMTRMDAERDLIKEVKANLFEEYKEHLSKRQIAKMARVYHKQNFQEEVMLHEQFETLYEEITGSKAE